MPSLNNPAGRLLRIANKAQEIPDNTGARKAWARILDVSPEDTARLLSRYRPVTELPEQIRISVLTLEGYPAPSAFIDPWIDDVEEGFARLHLNTKWKHYKDILNETVIQALVSCDQVLHQASPYRNVDTDKLAEIENQLHELLGNIHTAELSPTVQNFISRHIESILEAIAQYPVEGFEVFQSAVYSAIGEYDTNRTVRDELAKEPQNDTVNRFFGVLERGLVLISLIVAPAEIDAAMVCWFSVNWSFSPPGVSYSSGLFDRCI